MNTLSTCTFTCISVRVFTHSGSALKAAQANVQVEDRKSTRLNSSHQIISYAVFSFKKKHIPPSLSSLLFFFNDTATTEIYTLSLHDALPIYMFARLLS